MKSRSAPLLVLMGVMCSGPSVHAMPSSSAEDSNKAIVGRAHVAADSADDDEEREVRARTPEGISEAHFSRVNSAGCAAVPSASCVSEEIANQDRRLNEIYEELLAALHGETRESLVSAQRTWVQLSARDEELEDDIFGSEIISNVQRHQNRLFRICVRANTLDGYLAVSK